MSTESLFPPGSTSTAPPTRSCGRPRDGSISTRCPQPLTDTQKEFLWGTLLGDGAITWQARYGRFQITHGAVQELYCRHKEAMLADFVQTGAKIVENRGFGKLSCVFATLTSPAFELFREHCFRLSPETGRLAKTVTPEWCAALTWRSLAYWHMDDGCLTERNGVTLSTHGFSKPEVEMLAQRLLEFGVEAVVGTTHKGEKEYWYLRLSVEPARIFLAGTKPFRHGSMAYKWETSYPAETCAHCKEVFQPIAAESLSKFPCCQKPECRAAFQAYTDLRKEEWAALPENQQRINEASKARYWATPEESREYHRLYARQMRRDPKKAEELRAYKRAWRAAKKASSTSP